MLIYASLLGADLASYLEPTHPVQQRILDVVSAFSGIPAAQIGLSVDGCGAPVFALPLAAMATAYARLAAPEGFVDDDTAKAARTIGSSMQAKPLFVSGTGRICTALMEALAPAVVAKGALKGSTASVSPQRGGDRDQGPRWCGSGDGACDRRAPDGIGDRPSRSR